jgi:hypothetical protein
VDIVFDDLFEERYLIIFSTINLRRSEYYDDDLIEESEYYI